VIGRRRRESARAQARALWLDAVRIAEQAGSLDFRADPALHRRISQVCREAIADAFDAVWARKPAGAEPAIHQATAAHEEWAELSRRQLEGERRSTPPCGAAHVLVAPSLAELTVASVRDGSADLTEMHEAAELASQRTLLRLAKYLATGGSCEVTVEKLFELDAARALQATAGGPDGGR
jgi:hypothetical protein